MEVSQSAVSNVSQCPSLEDAVITQPLITWPWSAMKARPVCATKTKNTDREHRSRAHKPRAQTSRIKTKSTEQEHRPRAHRPTAQTSRVEPNTQERDRHVHDHNVSQLARLYWHHDWRDEEILAQTAATVVTHSCMRPDGPWCIERRSDKRPAVM